MSTTFLPCGVYHQDYAQDHAWWQTRFIKGKMLLLLAVVFAGIPLLADVYWISVFNLVGYTILGALGVQLLIGFCGQLTLGHAAFIAVGAYTSTLLILEFPWPAFMVDWGLAYPISILVAAVLFGALALATAPATTILVFKENRSEGQVTQYANTLVALNNVAFVAATWGGSRMTAACSGTWALTTSASP